EEFGAASANHALDQAFNKDISRAEYTSLPLTLFILLIAFGALVAAGLPVLLAFSAVVGAIGLNQVISHVVHTASATTSVIIMIGLALRIAHPPFHLQPDREAPRRGSPPPPPLPPP